MSRVRVKPPMRLRPQFLFALCIAVLAAWALIETRTWPIKTALYPRAVAIPLFVLAAVESVLSLRGVEATESAGQPTDITLSSSIAPHVAMRRTVATFAWLGGFFLAVVLVGFPRAIPLFVFAYLKGYGREGWVISVSLAALAWLGFHLLFIRLLHVPFATGLLWQAFGR